MNRDHVKGMGNQVKGEIKDQVGKATNDPGTQASGKLDKLKGKAQEAWGDVKDKASRALDGDTTDNTGGTSGTGGGSSDR